MQISAGLCRSTHAGYHGAEHVDNVNTAAVEGGMSAVWSYEISQTQRTRRSNRNPWHASVDQQREACAATPSHTVRDRTPYLLECSMLSLTYLQ